MKKKFFFAFLLFVLLFHKAILAQETKEIVEGNLKQKKIRVMAELAGLTGKKSLLFNQSFNGFDVHENTLSSRLSLQYNITSLLSVGVGTGVDYYQINTLLPTYLTITGSFLKKKVSPFYQVDVGHAFPWSDSEEDFTYEGGRYWGASVGLFSWLNNTQAIFVKVGYQQQKTTIIYPFNWGIPGESSQEHTLNRVRIGLGFVF